MTYFLPHSPRPVGGRAWHAGAVISMTPSPKQGPPHKSGARRTRSPCTGRGGRGRPHRSAAWRAQLSLSCHRTVSRPAVDGPGTAGRGLPRQDGRPQRPHRDAAVPDAAAGSELPGPAAHVSFARLPESLPEVSARSGAAGGGRLPRDPGTGRGGLRRSTLSTGPPTTEQKSPCSPSLVSREVTTRAGVA